MNSSTYKFLGDEFQNRHVKSGTVLISEPFLNDDNFSRSVVLITEHSSKGSFGLVLNKPISKNLSELLIGFDDVFIPLFSGGPVEQNTLHFIHSLGMQVPSTIPLSNNLFWGGDFDYLRLLVEKKQLDPMKIKFFIGYSGWVEHQLEEEIELNSWVVTNLNADDIFNLPPASLWSYCLESLGGKFKEWLNFPVDPILN